MIREDLPREAGKNGEYIIMYCPWCEHEQKELGYKVHAWTIIVGGGIMDSGHPRDKQ